MRKFARMLLPVLALTMVFPFGSCGGKDDLPPEAEGKTVVKVAFYAAGFGTRWMEDAKERYEALHPDVYLKLEGDPYIEDTVKQRLDTNKAELADDLCVFGGTYYRYMIRNNQLTELSSFYDELVEGDDTVNDLVNQQLKDYFTVNGEIYAIPWQDNAMSIVYNANMFDQYGWEIPQTMDAFFELCEEIRDDTNNSVHPLAYCGAANQGYFPNVMENWLCQYEGIDAMKTFLECETAEVYQEQIPGRTKVYETIAKLVHGTDSKGRRYVDPNARGYTSIDAQAEMLAGRSAMVVSGPWMQIEMSEYLVDYPGFRMGIMSTPHINSDMKDKNGNDSQYARTSSTGVMVIPKLAQHADIAMDFMKFMLTQESLQRFVETTDGLTRPYIIMAFQSVNLDTNELEFVGLGNFQKFFKNFVSWDKDTFWHTIGNSFGYWPVTYLISIPLQLAAAYFLYKKVHASGFIIVMIFLPNLIPPAVLAQSFTQMLSIRQGPLNEILMRIFGYTTETVPIWLTDERYAMGILYFYSVDIFLSRNLRFQKIKYKTRRLKYGEKDFYCRRTRLRRARSRILRQIDV